MVQSAANKETLLAMDSIFFIHIFRRKSFLIPKVDFFLANSQATKKRIC